MFLKIKQRGSITLKIKISLKMEHFCQNAVQAFWRMFVIGEFRKFKEDVQEENQGKVRKLAGEKDMAKTLRHKE